MKSASIKVHVVASVTGSKRVNYNIFIYKIKRPRTLFNEANSV